MVIILFCLQCDGVANASQAIQGVLARKGPAGFCAGMGPRVAQVCAFACGWGCKCQCVYACVFVCVSVCVCVYVWHRCACLRVDGVQSSDSDSKCHLSKWKCVYVRACVFVYMFMYV
jgi:hypothetical protein